MLGSTFRTQVYLTDPDYFCNKSWTLSYNMNTKTWVSFHSYIPNFYIGENNFFYSGINGCCDDFELIAGEIVPTPNTTTTTSSTQPVITTTTTTTVKDCNLEGEGRVTDCTLEGTGVITVPPPCVRPNGLRTFTLMTGYNIVLPPSTVVSTGSQTDACNAITYVTSTPNFTYTSISGQGTSLTIAQTVYANNGTTDCSVVPDGWYFTDESANTTTDVYQIVSGVIINIVQCFAPSTTTTTTTAIPCISYTAIKSTVGVVTVTYTDCTGLPASVNVGLAGGGPSSVTFCARCCPSTPLEVTLTNNGIC